MIIFAEQSQWIMDEWCPATEQKPQRWQRQNTRKKRRTHHQITRFRFSHFHSLRIAICFRPNMQNKQKFNRDKWFNMAPKWVSKKVKNKKWTQAEKKLSWTNNNHVCADSAWVATTTKTTKIPFWFFGSFFLPQKSFTRCDIHMWSKLWFASTFFMVNREYWQFDKSMGCLLWIAQTWPFAIMSK